MKVEIVTPVGLKYSGDAAGVIAPGSLGDVGILPGHQPMVAGLRTGICVIQNPGGTAKQGVDADLRLLVDGGYLHVVGGQTITITTELCEQWDEVDVPAARKTLEAATAELLASREETSSQMWLVKKHRVDLADARVRIGAMKP